MVGQTMEGGGWTEDHGEWTMEGGGWRVNQAE